MGGVLRQNCDAALFFKIIGIHHPFCRRLAAVQGTGLPQQLVYQRGFAVIDVGDDGDIA